MASRPKTGEFFILSMPRSGTRMLTTALDAIPGCTVVTEAFNPDVEPDERQHLWQLPVGEVWEYFARRHPDANHIGTVVQLGQCSCAPAWSNLLEWVRARRRAKFVYLRRRNQLERACSLLAAEQTGLWHQEDVAISVAREKMVMPPHWLVETVRGDQLAGTFVAELGRDRAILEITYESVAGDDANQMRRLLGFLGIESEPPLPSTAKQQTRPPREYLQNYTEIAEFLRLAGYEQWL